MTQILVMLEKECRVEKWNRGKSGSQRKGCSMKKSLKIVWRSYKRRVIISAAIIICLIGAAVFWYSLYRCLNGDDEYPKLSSDDTVEQVPLGSSTPVFVPSRETLPQSSTAAP